LLDEATASVDNETDAIIQQIVKKEFGDKTVIMIAHRLNTIMDSDKIIMVLDEGMVVEFGEPAKLLVNSSGVFYKLVENTGKETARFLHKLSGVTDVDALI